MTVIPFPRPPSGNKPINPDLNQADYNALQPRHLRIALADINVGIKQRAPGIRRCHDCASAYIDDHSGLPHCRDCRTNHTRPCDQCRTRFRNTTNGDQLCQSCAAQTALF
jgi:hypothetical protein